MALLVTWPVFVAVAVAVRLDSPGPAFYRQERVGLGGEIFRIHKFRTMRGGHNAAMVSATGTAG